jgi:hypothetical protein
MKIESAFGVDVKDPAVREAFAQKMKTYDVNIDPKAVLIGVINNNGWSDENIEALSKMTAADFVKLFKSIEGPDLSLVIRAALEFGRFGNASEAMKKIAENSTEALREIAAESVINARRVGRYGISPAAKGEEPGLQ